VTERRINRCAWVGSDNPLMLEYHDREWGVPVHDDRKHFEFLVLEGAQAGLSWSIVLKKREGYRRAFSRFDPRKVARYTLDRIQTLTANPSIIRNRLKIESAVRNARAFLAIQDEFGSFDAYCWRFVDGRPRLNRWKAMRAVGMVNDHRVGCFRYRETQRLK
jgi:DNA-3-methyladenine glycosylase I